MKINRGNQFFFSFESFIYLPFAKKDKPRPTHFRVTFLVGDFRALLGDLRLTGEALEIAFLALTAFFRLEARLAAVGDFRVLPRFPFRGDFLPWDLLWPSMAPAEPAEPAGMMTISLQPPCIVSCWVFLVTKSSKTGKMDFLVRRRGCVSCGLSLTSDKTIFLKVP